MGSVNVYTEIWKKSCRDSKAPKIMSSRNQLREDQNQLIRMPKTRIGFLRISPADNDEGYDSAPGRNMLDSVKGERLESKLS